MKRDIDYDDIGLIDDDEMTDEERKIYEHDLLVEKEFMRELYENI